MRTAISDAVMNTKHALGFLAAGVLMKLIPAVWPAWFPPTAADGGNASATWLMCMGLVLAVIGGGFLLKHWIFPSILRTGAYRAPARARFRLKQGGLSVARRG